MRSTALLFHTLLSFVSVTSVPRTEPSFECSRAARPDERAICNDQDLAERDQLGSQIFAMLARRPDSAAAGAAESLRFIAARRNCGAEIDCIRREQNALLVALVRIAAPLPRPVEAKIESTVRPRQELLLRGLGAILGILLCVAFGWFVRSVIIALWRSRPRRASDDHAIQGVSEQSLEPQSASDTSLESAADRSLETAAASPSAGRGWLAGMYAWWRRYRKNASANRAIREIRREKRRPTRFRQGKLYDAHGFFLTQCTICDRSKGGARVRVDNPPMPLDFVRFHDDVEKIIVEAKVAWQRGNELGLAFLTAAKSAELAVVRLSAGISR
jgi:uncharacterized protein